MRWAVVNALGAAAWLVGLMYAKGLSGPADQFFAANDHHLLLGACVGIAGLGALLWENLRSAS